MVKKSGPEAEERGKGSPVPASGLAQAGAAKDSAAKIPPSKLSTAKDSTAAAAAAVASEARDSATPAASAASSTRQIFLTPVGTVIVGFATAQAYAKSYQARVAADQRVSLELLGRGLNSIGGECACLRFSLLLQVLRDKVQVARTQLVGRSLANCCLAKYLTMP